MGNGSEFSTRRSEPLLNRGGTILPSAAQPLFEHGEAWDRDKDQHGFWKSALDRHPTLDINVEHNILPFPQRSF